MARSQIQTHQLDNGLTLVSEAIPEVRAAAFQILIPAGAATEPESLPGLTAVLENTCYRGAGSRSARELSDALDTLGVQRGGGANLETTSFGATLLADDLHQALEIYADIVRRPLLPPDQVEGARQLALQRLESLQDNPTQRLFIELAAAYFPGPYGRSSLGTREGLNAITPGALREDHQRRFVPEGSIFAVAGRFDWQRTLEVVQRLFGDWEGRAVPLPTPDSNRRERYRHLSESSAQEQIGVAWPGLPADHPEYYPMRLALQVLSGGMGARLFTEVREKRGLVYSVGASPRTMKGTGIVLGYAGTTPDRRQECIDVLLQELVGLKNGVTEAELARARTGLLSSLVMQGESCSARASAIARDQFLLGRVRPLDEVRAQIEQVTTASIQSHLDAHPPGDFTVVTLGPEPVELAPAYISSTP